MKDTLNRLLAFHTGKEIDQISMDTDRDFFMNGLEAKEYGIIDHVISSRDDLENVGEGET